MTCWVVELREEGVALEDASHEQRGLGAHAEDDLVGLMLAAPRLPSPAHLLTPTGTPLVASPHSGWPLLVPITTQGRGGLAVDAVLMLLGSCGCGG